MIAIQEGVPLVPCGLDTFQWSLKNRRKCAIVWGEPIDLSGLPRSGKGYKEGAADRGRGDPRALAAGGGGGRRRPSRDASRRLPAHTGRCKGDEVSYIDATPWPDDEWARGPLGPVYPGAS